MNTPALTWGDLVWSHFSRPRFDPIPERIAAAGLAGFNGIGLYAHAYGRWLETGHTVEELRDLLTENKLVLAEVEAMKGWWADSGPAAEEANQVEHWAFELAKSIGVRYLQVIGPYDVNHEIAVERFGQLCDRAADHGMLVGIEWLPFTNITGPIEAQRIVEAADRPNGGYCVDIWHHARGANYLPDLLALDPSKVLAIQMNDGTIQPADADYKRDCLANRMLPGEGEFGCAAFARALYDNGVRAPMSAEVCSPTMWELPVNLAASECARALRAVTC